MPTWDPERYLAFADERGRPFRDLLARIPTTPASIVDLGCGPGQLSAVLRERWPAADIVGIDSSPQMLEQARAGNDDPRVRYRLADVRTWQPEEPVDLIVSNATFQWVPEQLELIPGLRDRLRPGGVLAFGVPHNYTAPSHTLLYELAGAPAYRDRLEHLPRRHGTDARTYLDLLAGPSWRLDVWTTTYCHVLHGPDAVFRWITGTGARPFLQALDGELREQFAREYAGALRSAYPERPYGTVLEFERVFVVARHVATVGAAEH